LQNKEPAMGLLDSLTSLAGGGSANGGLLPIVLQQLAKYPGGVAGLIADFQRGGLGGLVQSWIGTGANEPVSGQQLDGVLDRGVVDGIAEQSGQDRGSVLDALAGLLPQIVDGATPDGTAQGVESFNASSLLGMLAQFTRQG